MRKGILLAGGFGTRFYPATRSISKQLLPVYDKPMIYYPLSVLMLAGIREILIISTPQDLPNFEQLFGTGEQLGLSFSYAEQPNPEGLAQAFIIGEEFIGDDSVCMILGDNLFYGQDLSHMVQQAARLEQGGIIFGYPVKDPQRYGVAEIDAQNRVLSIEEKPAKPKSNLALVGLYFFDNRAARFAREIIPSLRGELEITSLMQRYLDLGELDLVKMRRGMAWLDTGTHDSLLAAAQFVEIIEKRQGLQIACIEEIAWRLGYITAEQLKKIAESYGKSAYGEYLRGIVSN